MQVEMLHRYLAGDRHVEPAAVQELRRAGEAAAHRLRLQPADVDAVGVDFAAYLLTQAHPAAPRERHHLGPYVRQAARWFASKQSRGGWHRRVELMDETRLTGGGETAH